MKHGSLFSGIGGFDLAAEWMRWENVFHCEWNPFGQKVLKHYWPNAESFNDITKTDFTKYANRINVLTGGFPCQPYSIAGKRKGKSDERHLWPEMLRAIREIQPGWVVGENVRGIINWNAGMVFDEVQADLESQDYKVVPFLLPASGCGFEHERFRTWFIAYSDEKRRKIPFQSENNGIKNEWNRREEIGGQNRVKLELAPDSRSVLDKWANRSNITELLNGFSSGLDTKTIFEESTGAYGNAIVPQVAHQIFKAIEQYEQLQLI